MKVLSQLKLSELVKSNRNVRSMTQDELSDLTGINRAMIGKIERKEYIPSILQLEKLADVLHFDLTDVFEESKPMVYTAFRGNNLSAEEQTGVDNLFKMMVAAKQQILLRKALHDEK